MENRQITIFFDKLERIISEKDFIKLATAQGMVELKGHRSVGGCRASIYNAMPVAGCEALAAFMGEFAKKNG